MGPALLGCDGFCSGQQCLVTARATEQLVLMNRPVMEGSRFSPQMNRGLSGCLLVPPPPLLLLHLSPWLAWSHSQH